MVVFVGLLDLLVCVVLSLVVWFVSFVCLNFMVWFNRVFWAYRIWVGLWWLFMLLVCLVNLIYWWWFVGIVGLGFI